MFRANDVSLRLLINIKHLVKHPSTLSLYANLISVDAAVFKNTALGQSSRSSCRPQPVVDLPKRIRYKLSAVFNRN